MAPRAAPDVLAGPDRRLALCSVEGPGAQRRALPAADRRPQRARSAGRVGLGARLVADARAGNAGRVRRADGRLGEGRRGLPARERKRMSIRLRVNGVERTLEVDPQMPILWALRDVLGLTGTK